MTLNREQRIAALEVYRATADAIRDLSEASPLGGVPAGELFVLGGFDRLMTAETFNAMTAGMARAGIITNHGHLLKWIGPKGQGATMTMSDAMNGGIDDGTEPVEALPHDEIETATAGVTEEPETPPAKVVPLVRHLAVGAATATLCGLDRAGLATVHPSKARKTDCQACKDALRAQAKLAGVAPKSNAAKAGDKIEFPDGSAWLVEDVRAGGMDVRCVIAGGTNKKGATTVISPDSPLRVFTEAEFEAALAAAKKPEPAAPAADGTTAPKPRASSAAKWRPTKADVDEVRRLRALGRAYIPIERAMGWPDGHGNRPFRIIKGAWNYDALDAGTPRTEEQQLAANAATALGK